MQFDLPQHISNLIFRAYDIRGIVDETLTSEMVYAIGLALGKMGKAQEQYKFVLARDGRNSSPLFATAIAQGLIESGYDVIDIGAVPTPLLYFATYILDAASGVMVTGSHNPANENGLKIIINHRALKEEQIQELYTYIQKRDFFYAEQHGSIETINIIPAYYATIEERVSIKKKLRVVIDGGNGITGKVAPNLIRQLGCEVIELFCAVDGNFPNHFPDPSNPQNLKDLIKAVQTHHADLGLAFDGDGDRLGVVTNLGEIIWPDRQLILFSQDILSHHPGGTIIYDVKCSRLVEEMVNQYGGNPLMWKCGHSLIKAKIRETNAVFAGEMSGHFFFNDKWYGFDDAIYAGVRLLEILAKDDRTIAEVFAQIPDSINTPELKIEIAEEKKLNFIKLFQNQAVFPQGRVIKIDGVRVDFNFGFGLVRASNTTPNLILRFEADSQENLQKIQNQFKQQLLNLDSKLVIPF